MASQRGSCVKLIAQHSYHTGDPTHLSFPAQATIIAKTGQDGNALWYGHYGSQRGWFAPSYCRLQPCISLRLHASFNGVSSPTKQTIAPTRTHSWSVSTNTQQELHRRERVDDRDASNTELKTIEASSSSGDDQENQAFKRTLPPPRHREAHGMSSITANDDVSSTVSSTALTPKRKNRPLLGGIRFKQGSIRKSSSARSASSSPALLPRTSSKLRSFFKERSERQAPPSISPVPERDFVAPLPRRRESLSLSPRKEQRGFYDEQATYGTEFSTSAEPVDPIDVWAAEFRMRQLQSLPS